MRHERIEIYVSDHERTSGIVRWNFSKQKSGEYSEEATPVPISNTVVKLFCADGTWWATAWKNRSLPVRKNTRFRACVFYAILPDKSAQNTGVASST